VSKDTEQLNDKLDNLLEQYKSLNQDAQYQLKQSEGLVDELIDLLIEETNEDNQTSVLQRFSFGLF
jgi:hypothetical protein